LGVTIEAKPSASASALARWYGIHPMIRVAKNRLPHMNMVIDLAEMEVPASVKTNMMLFRINVRNPAEA